MVILVGFSIYAIVNFARYGQVFGKPKYIRVELVELLSFGNFYNGKSVCTRGYYVEDEKLRLLKVSLAEDRYTRVAWVITGNLEIITRIPGAKAKFVEAELCGEFESSRNGEFGEPPVWIAQITVESYKTFGDVQELETQI
mgnify:CR=1 FL=1